MDRRRLIASLGAAWLAGRLDGVDATVAPSTGVEVVVLGTAQDAGVPQVNCFQGHCARVRAGEAPSPRVACLGLIDHGAGRRFLIDATPDFNAQVQGLIDAANARSAVAGATVPLHEHLHGILLTHAHMGHYSGLVHIGREGAAPRVMPVYGSAQMAGFLRSNGPWDALAKHEHADFRIAVPGQPIALTGSLTVTPFAVVHRAEYTDTLGYIVSGPERALLYVPDADVWDGWETPFEELLQAVDVALIDGSFWSYDELGHRVQADIPHPPVSASIERLRDLEGRPEIRFIHLNHTNPLWDDSAPQHALLPVGFELARTGERHAL